MCVSQWLFAEGFIAQDEKVIQFPYHVRNLCSFAKTAIKIFHGVAPAGGVT